MRLVPAVVTPDVITALQRIKEKTGEKWTPDFVLAAVREGRAGLFGIYNVDTLLAYMVCERMDQGDGVWMNVWCVEGAGLEHMQSLIPLVDELARSIGARSWRATGRKGWSKWLKPVATVYEREVT